MNEERKKFYDYMNSNVSEQKIDATDLSLQMTSFLRNNKLESWDWIVLDGLIKQLSKSKFHVSRKVLRSIHTKFEKIQNKYQR